ncbi:hypothetical protein SAMN04488515_2026 [Cognatiyoonia koreensis]|uniref:Lipoprotein n=1 Tax=Cognatiyoonia koreensis TaxID=364200 RepID=A0A1I0QN42_9RHOB|nr:hypothetical protein [Cognatiyoonia koreensis]SEW28535.1 hypothetical protein SAMN04488515_2026 [Cognatiyoonia koreensis]
MKRIAFVLLSFAITACTPMSPERAADRCEERARGAQAPEAELTIGANSNSGPFAEGSISITSDFVQGRDPLAVYESCVFQLTGELPIRPPRLRDL